LSEKPPASWIGNAVVLVSDFVRRYADMSVVRENRTEIAVPRDPLDTSGLNLEPVIVSLYIRL
jgi:hypothetical protein